MSAWTAERLDALPEGAVVAIWPSGFFTKDSDGAPDRPWAYSRGGRESSRGIVLLESVNEDTGSGSIRVVSVPVNALLEELPEPEPYLPSLTGNEIWEYQGWNDAIDVMRTAIAHVTGEQS